MRITHLRDALDGHVDLDVVSGFRGPRRVSLVRYALSGRLRGLGGVYVESSSALPSETDIAFLALARSLRIPVLTFIRDAYQLFPDYYATDTLRRRLSSAAFLPMMRALAAVSSSVAAPSDGLARAVFGDRPVLLLPPGSPPPVEIGPVSGAREVLFVGNGRDAVQGAPALIEAIGRVRSLGIDIGLVIVCRPGEEPRSVPEEGVRVVRAEGTQIHSLLPGVTATVIPRPRNAYNDLALPVKLFEYLAFGRPLLVTDCEETALLVRREECGLVVGDSVEDLARGLAELAAMDPSRRAALGAAAHRAARRQTWERRAGAILAELGIPSRDAGGEGSSS